MATSLGALSLLLSLPPDLLHGPSHLPASYPQPAHSRGPWVFSDQLPGKPAIRVSPVWVYCTSVSTSAGCLLFHGFNTEPVSSLEHSLGPLALDLLDLRDPDARPSFPEVSWLTSAFPPTTLECSFRTFQKHSLTQWAPRIHYTTQGPVKAPGRVCHPPSLACFLDLSSYTQALPPSRRTNHSSWTWMQCFGP